MQIEAIKNPGRINALDFGDTVLLTDGWKGPYIQKDKALINLDKIRHPDTIKDNFNPNRIKLFKIKMTKHLLVTTAGRIVRRFDTEENEHIWVRNDWINEYDNAFSYATEETKQSVIPIGINGAPMGVVLCMHIDNEDN